MDNGLFVNCKATSQDVRIQNKIYGEPVALIDGKMTREHPVTHTHGHLLPLDELIPKEYANVSIFADVFFINKIPFMHTKSKNIEFRLVQPLRSQKMKEIIEGVKIVKQKYMKRGFVINRWHVDNEFDTSDL